MRCDFIRPLYLNPAVDTELGLVRQGLPVSGILSCLPCHIKRGRRTERGVPRRWKGLMGVVARPDVYATASAEPRPSAPAGSPRPSKAVNNNDIDCMIIYWIWLKFYLNTT